MADHLLLEDGSILLHENSDLMRLETDAASTTAVTLVGARLVDGGLLDGKLVS